MIPQPATQRADSCVLRPDPIPDLKRELAKALVDALRGSQPSEIWFLLKLDQPRVWELRHGRLDRFSVQKLVRLLAELGFTVRVAIDRERGREGLAKASP